MMPQSEAELLQVKYKYPRALPWCYVYRSVVLFS